MKRVPWIAALPFFVSLACSAATLGGHVGWQDSGYFLCAIHETAVLYPTGFVLYLLACKGWTLLLFFLDFTVAVHLFSALCAAAGSAVLAVAARELIGTRGPVFRTGGPQDPACTNVSAAAVGVLAATGYTFWYTALLAKGYAFYYLILTLLLWRMIRADASGKPRDFTIVALLIGLAWQGHPSSINTGLALIAFVLVHRPALGWKGIAWRFGLAAACALGPLALLPVLAANPSIVAFGDPRSWADFAEYLFGGRFTHQAGVFGPDATRIRSVALYLWEEMLAVGLLGLALGAVHVVRMHSRLRWGLLLWIVPVLTITVLFKIEGQHDCWFLAAWIPCWMVAALGFAGLGHRVGAHGARVIIGMALAGSVWAVVQNYPLVNQRGYVLAEQMGRMVLDPVEPGAIVILRTDDVVGPALWLTVVQNHRPDVLVVRASHLGEEWYSRALRSKDATLVEPDYARFRRRAPKGEQMVTGEMAFANANVSATRPVYFEFPPPEELVRPDFSIVPAGALSRMVPRGQEKIDRKFWSTPVEAEELIPLCRRARGQRIEYLPGGLLIEPEAYERRLIRMLLKARKNLADWHGHSSDPERMRRAAELYESLIRLEPRFAEDVSVIVPLGVTYLRLKQPEQAELWLRRSMSLELAPALRALATVALFEACRDSGRTKDAEIWRAKAVELPGLTDDLRRRLSDSR